MQEEESRLREEARRLLAEAEQTDKDEDKRYGRVNRGDELPAELARQEARLQRIIEATRELEARARAEAEQKQKTDKSDKNGSGSGRTGSRSATKPQPKMQHNFTDPESRIMKGCSCFQ